MDISKQDMLERHKKESKELQCKIQALKNSVPKGDKRRKKQAQLDIAQLEQEMQERHTQELSQPKPSSSNDKLVAMTERLGVQENGSAKEDSDKETFPTPTSNETTSPASPSQTDSMEDAKPDKELSDSPGNSSSDRPITPSPNRPVIQSDQPAAPTPQLQEQQPKLSKAQKKRLKKEQEAHERDKRIAEAEKESESHSRNIEAMKLITLLRSRGLRTEEVTPDGNCLFNAILVHMRGTPAECTCATIRQQTCDYMLGHADDFLPFTMKQDTGDMMNYDEFQAYCEEVRDTNAWGGQMELRAISQLYSVPIEVYQADIPVLTIGEEFQNKRPIRVSYHRHQYGLGEHYNAVIEAPPS